MDSPSDFSPNAPPTGFEDSATYFSQLQGAPPANDQKSADGSVDSSGYEKVDHDVLEEYGQQFANQMQQSIFGQLPEDPFKSEMVPSDGDTVKIDSAPTNVGHDHEHQSDSQQQVPTVPGGVTDLISDLEHSSHALVAEAVNKAEAAFSDLLGSDHIVPEVPTHGDAHSSDITDAIVQDVDDLVQLQESDQFPEVVTSHHSFPGPDVDLLQDEEPHFDSQTPEEVPYTRTGPLTIPELSEKLETITDPEPEEKHSPIVADKPAFKPEPLPSTVEEPTLTHRTHAPEPVPQSRPAGASWSNDGKPWFDFKSIDPRVLELIYWRDPKKSAVALSLVLIAIFILGKYPILSVLSYSGLAVLAATLGFRIFKAVEAQIKKTGGENPFQEYLAKDLTLPQERVHAQVDVLAEHGSLLANQVKKLVFVESIVDSVKFGLLLWSLTYIASWFSGFTLIILAVLGVFSVPIFYETYKEPIDAQLAVISGHINNVTQLLEEKLPFLKRAEAVKEE